MIEGMCLERERNVDLIHRDPQCEKLLIPWTHCLTECFGLSQCVCNCSLYQLITMFSLPSLVNE